LDRKIANRIPDYIDTVKLLKQLVQMNPQFELDGERNIWIVKPAGSSRGRGIVLYKNLVEIMDVVSNKSNKTTDLLQWIVQKYIENPLIVMNRKFDLR
jgi:tubulin monoglycylase TTLL3/8